MSGTSIQLNDERRAAYFAGVAFMIEKRSQRGEKFVIRNKDGQFWISSDQTGEVWRGHKTDFGYHFQQEIYQITKPREEELAPQYTVIPEPDGSFTARVYDAPASGFRTLLVDRGGEIGKFENRFDAMAAITAYTMADKELPQRAEKDTYLDAAMNDGVLGEHCIAALVRLEWGGEHVYATYHLSREFITTSYCLKIIGLDGNQTLYSPGWERKAAS